MKKHVLALAIIVIGTLAGCNDHPQPSTDTAQQSPSNPVQASTAGSSSVQGASSFNLDLSKGITADGVQSIEGLGEQEPWGRWSTADTVVVKLVGSVKPALKLTVSGMAYGPNAGKPVDVTIGGETKSLVFTKADVNETYSLNFEKANGDKVEFKIPQPTSPGKADPRTLGIGFTGIRVDY